MQWKISFDKSKMHGTQQKTLFQILQAMQLIKFQVSSDDEKQIDELSQLEQHILFENADQSYSFQNLLELLFQTKQ